MSWTLIESQTLGASAASVNLGSGGTIPQTYKSLMLVISARSTQSAWSSGMYIGFNGNTSTLYSNRELYGYSTGAASRADTNSPGYVYAGAIPAASDTSNTFSCDQVVIPNYTTSQYKPFSCDVVDEGNTSTAYNANLWMTAGLWSSTAAVTSVQAYSSVNFTSGSTFTLYGLK